MENDNDKAIDFIGIVTEVAKGCNFIVKVDNFGDIKANLSGRMRLNKIRILLGDKVKVACSPYDLTRGRITMRF
jgi:translation initiation factor IF-1